MAKKKKKRQPVAKKKVKKKVKAKKKPPKKKVKAKKKVKKKPPRKKRKPVQKKVSVEIPIHDQGDLRFAASMVYISTPRGVSLVEMGRMEQFKGVTRRTLETWSAEDGWRDKRIEFQEAAKSRVSTELMNKLVQARNVQLNDLAAMWSDGFAQMFPKGRGAKLRKPQVKSYEGLLNAMIRLHESIDGTRERMAESFIPETFRQAPDEMGTAVGMPITPQLTQEEARAAAKLMIQMRMAAQLEDDETLEEESDDEDPQIIDAVLSG